MVDAQSSMHMALVMIVDTTVSMHGAAWAFRELHAVYV